jgi:hypothetical protein
MPQHLAQTSKNFIPKGPYSGPLTYPVTKEEFFKSIGKSPGKSSIPYEVLKNLPDSAVELYITLFN